MEWHLKFQSVKSTHFIFALMFLIANQVFAITAPKFEKIEIELEYRSLKKTLKVDAAETPAQQAYGLMNRKKLGKNEGMIFIFQNEQFRQFWMKDTLIDLDIAYIDKNFIIIDIQQMAAMKSVMQSNHPTYPSTKPAQYALEMNKDWFKKNGFGLGTKVKLRPRPKSK